MDTDRPQRSGGRRRDSAATTASIGATGLMLAGFILYSDTGNSGNDLSVSAPPSPPLSTEAVTALFRSEPVALEIPAIDLRTDHFVRLGLHPDGEIETPEDYEAVGWYGYGPSPGQVGAAVIGGHVDSATAPAVFHRLEELRPGHTIMVEREDGSTALFTVYEVQRHAKDEFPTERVYGPTGGHAELRLITCGGEFDQTVQSYRDNTVVYATLTSTHSHTATPPTDDRLPTPPSESSPP